MSTRWFPQPGDTAMLRPFSDILDFAFSVNETTLTILPVACLILALPFVFILCRRREEQVLPSPLLSIKMIIAGTLTCVECSTIISWKAIATQGIDNATSAIVLLGAICLVAIINYHHRFTLRSSGLFAAWYTMSAICDVLRLRLMYPRPGYHEVTILITFSLLLKVVLLLLDELPKAHYIQDEKLRKHINPALTAGFWSRVFLFSFSYSIVFDFSNPIDIDQRQQLLPTESSEHLFQKFHASWSHAKNTPRRCLLKMLYRIYIGSVMKTVFPHLLNSFFALAQPVFIRQLLLALAELDESPQGNFCLIAAALCTYTGLLVTNAICKYSNGSVALNFRGSLLSSIQMKIFELPHSIAQEATAIKLIENNVDDVVDTIDVFTGAICNLIIVVVSSIWLIQVAGYASILVFTSMIIYCVVSHYNGARKLASRLTLDMAAKCRIVMTSNVLRQIKAVRTTGLDEVISRNLDQVCREEVDCFVQVRLWATIFTLTLTFLSFTTGPLLVGGAIYATSSLEILSPAYIFPCIAISIVCKDSYADILNLIAKSKIYHILECSKNIEDFLSLQANDQLSESAPKVDELPDISIAGHAADATQQPNNITHGNYAENIKRTMGLLLNGEQLVVKVPAKATKRPSASQSSPDCVIQLKDVSLGVHGTDRTILRNINLDINRNELIMVSGITGTGKSTFLRAFIKDSCLLTGSLIKEYGITGYCDQRLWLQQRSIRDNIIGNLPFDQDWYDTVLDACLLKKDLSRLANNDRTLVGSNGTNLSSAQGYRVALARALYLRAPYLVLDNTFAGLDYGSYCEIFKRLFGANGVLRKSPATVIMTTHSTQFLEDADKVIFIHSDNTVSIHTDIRSARFRDCWTTLGIIENSTETFDTKPEAEEAAKSVSLNEEQNMNTVEPGELALYKLYSANISRGKIILSLFWYFMGALSLSIPYFYLSLWSEMYPDTATPFIGYALLSILAVISSALLITIWEMLVTPSASMRIHEMLCDTIMRSKFSFLTRISPSNMLYLFSADMGSIINTMPNMSLRVVYGIFWISLHMIMISATNRYCLVLSPILTVWLCAIRSIYSRSCRQVRGIEVATRTQLHSHLDESISGLRYIRASGSRSQFEQKSLSLLNDSQVPHKHMVSTQRWLSVVIDFVLTTEQLAVIASAIFAKQTTSPAAVGASLLLTMTFEHDLNCITQDFMTVQICLGSLARIQEFIDTTPKEKAIEAIEQQPAAVESIAHQQKAHKSTTKNKGNAPKDNVPQAPHNADPRKDGFCENEQQPNAPLPADWPSRGCVVFTDVTAKYDSDSTAPPAIQEVSITIPAGKKVGIVGRTGSGKTSLLMTLLNFLDYSGTITVDGYDISEIPYLTLRQKITTISQDIIDLGGTVQYNLCPWTMSVTDSDEGNVILDSLKIVLESLNMWEVIEKGGGVTAIVADLELSHGQMQLLTIARGMLHNLRTGSNVVIMDELTSHLDPRNEKIVKAALDKAFRDRTVISVVHREGLLKGADIVLRMEDGKIVETKYPTASKAKTTTTRTTQAQASSSRRAGPPRPQVAPGPSRVIAPALQAMMDYMNDPNAPEPLDPNRHAIAELRMNFERRRMGLPPTTLPRQADDPSRPFSWSEQVDQPVQPQQAEPSQQNNQASRLGLSQRPDRTQQARQSRRPQ